MAATAERVDKFAERRAALADAAVRTLAELGYARTGLRDIAENSDFSHGVLHYYFRDKADLILQVVRQTKQSCMTRYDDVVLSAASFDTLMDGFLNLLGQTVRQDAHLHRLWYDMRNQALFEPELRTEVTFIDGQLRDMIWRVICRFHTHAGSRPTRSAGTVYALFDGLFQHALLHHASGDPHAVDAMCIDVGQLIRDLTLMPRST